MKEIKAVIQHGKLQKLREALGALPGFPGMTIANSEGCGPSHGNSKRQHSVREELTDFSPKVRIEIVAPSEQVVEIVRVIRQAAHTGLPGDGVVWVTEVEEFYRIRE